MPNTRTCATATNSCSYSSAQLQLSVGATAPLTPWLTVGANYLYHRQTESVTYQTYGKTDRIYLSLIDYAAFMGFSEQYGTAGFTDNSREMPLVEDRNGGSVQIDVRPLRDLSFHNELTYTHGKGYYGRKSPYTIVYTNHQRDVFSYQGRVVLQRPHTHHLLDLSAAVEKLDNNRENYRERQNEAGSTYYEYYSDVQTAKKRWYHFSALYTLHLGIRGEQPLWTLSAAYHWQQRQQTAYLYPYYRHQQLTTHTLTASILRNVLTRRGVWTASLQGSYQKGSGAPYTDGTYATPSEKQAPPATMNTFLYQDYHLLTSPQFALAAEGKYAFRFPHTQLLTHVRLNIEYRRATQLAADDCGRQWTALTLAAGCTF